MENIYRKKLTINDLMHPYHITNEYDSSYMVHASDNIIERYPSFTESSEIVNEHIKAFNEDGSFYNTSKYMNPYSLIVSNNSYINNNNDTIIENSYIIYYNSSDGLYQFTYIIQEGNGLYNDEKNHIMTMNVDNKSIREVNNRLYYNIESVPTSTSYKPGIHKINPNDFIINNDNSISVNYDRQIDVISLKNDCKMIYMNINSLYNELNYLYEIQNSVTGLSNFKEQSNYVSEYQINNQQNTQIVVTYKFISPKIKYSDNYYKSVGFISSDKDISIELDDTNTIYTKNIDLLDIIIDNNYTPSNKYYSQTKNIASFIIMNYNDERNNFNINCTSKLKFLENKYEIINEDNTHSYVYPYCYTINNIDLKNKVNSKELFKKYGCTLSINLKRDYTIEGNKITYFQYSTDNMIKIIYDHRQIDNILVLNIGQSTINTYYMFSYKYDFNKYSDKNIIKNNLTFLIKIGLIWQCSAYNLYLGYSTRYKRLEDNKKIYNKKYYKVWNYNISLKYLDYDDLNEFNPLLDYNEYPEIASKSEYSFNEENNIYTHETGLNYSDHKKIYLYKIEKLLYGDISITKIENIENQELDI